VSTVPETRFFRRAMTRLRVRAFAPARALNRWVRRWALARQGADPDPVTLVARRIYILPTALGVAFAAMLFAMLLGAMNYANNLALGLVFMLGALALVAMHHCHRTLNGLRLTSVAAEPVFAGQTIHFRVAVENPSAATRHEIAVDGARPGGSPVSIDGGGRVVLEIQERARRRGIRRLDRFQVSTRYPFGMFRAWAWVHMELGCVVYPCPSDRNLTPPLLQTDVGGPQDSSLGDEDFAGLRSFHAGDSLRRVAWKAYARGQGLHVKQFAGTAVTSHVFEWDSLEGLDTEARLAQLCRWIVDAHAAGRAYGVRLPGLHLPPNLGSAHRHRCLLALALFENGIA